MKKVTIEHRKVRVPAPSLSSPRMTGHKMRAEGHCRMCLRPDRVRPLTKHHLVPESWFIKQPFKLRMIRNAHANVIPLCRPCHDMVDSRDEDERLDARRLLRRCLGQSEIAFMIQVRGIDWVNWHYPRH